MSQHSSEWTDEQLEEMDALEKCAKETIDKLCTALEIYACAGKDCDYLPKNGWWGGCKKRPCGMAARKALDEANRL